MASESLLAVTLSNDGSVFAVSTSTVYKYSSDGKLLFEKKYESGAFKNASSTSDGVDVSSLVQFDLETGTFIMPNYDVKVEEIENLNTGLNISLFIITCILVSFSSCLLYFTKNNNLFKKILSKIVFFFYFLFF